MSMISNSSKYALKAVLYLTMHTDEQRKMQVREISDNIQVPRAYTAKLLQALARQDVISSSRGPKGGFYINETDRKQSIMKIIDVIDGRKKIEACILGLDNCDEEKPCPLHNLIASSRSKMIRVFEEISLEELAQNLRDKQSFLPL